MSIQRKITLLLFGRSDSDISRAERRGDEEDVKFLLNQLAPEQNYEILKGRDSLGNTVLHWAADAGKIATTGVLLSSLTPEDQLALLKVQNSLGSTALHWAAVRGQSDTAGVLLNSLTSEHQLTQLKVQNEQGRTALHYAAAAGHTDTVRVLLSCLTPEHQLTLLDMQNNAGRAARDEAVKEGYMDTGTCLQEIRDAAEGAISDRIKKRLQDGVTEEDLADVLRAVGAVERRLEAKVDQQDNKISELSMEIRERDTKIQKLEAALRDTGRATLGNSEEIGRLQNQQFRTEGLIDAVVESFTAPVRAAEVVDGPLEVEGDMVSVQEAQQ